MGKVKDHYADEIEARAIIDGTKDADMEANQFAMELLMPEFLMRQEMAKLRHVDIEDEKTVEKLAKKFRVSRQVMTLRLGQLSGVL